MRCPRSVAALIPFGPRGPSLFQYRWSPESPIQMVHWTSVAGSAAAAGEDAAGEEAAVTKAPDQMFYSVEKNEGVSPTLENSKIKLNTHGKQWQETITNMMTEKAKGTLQTIRAASNNKMNKTT